MTAIYKKELKSYLTSMIGYLFMAFTLALFGLYFTAINLQQGYPEIGYALQNSAFILLIAVPVLTMRVLSEEQKNKTDQLLLTAPVKISDIILGKYLALLTIYVIPVLIMCLYPLLLGTHGTVSYAVSYTSILGYFLLGAAYISVGVFVSSITESQGVAAGLCFVVLLVCYFLPDLSDYFSTSAFASFAAFTVVVLLIGLIFRLMTRNTPVSVTLMVVLEVALILGYGLGGDSFAGLFPSLVEELSLFEKFYQFVDGIFDVRCLVYFLTVILVFLFLTVQSLEKRRWSE